MVETKFSVIAILALLLLAPPPIDAARQAGDYGIMAAGRQAAVVGAEKHPQASDRADISSDALVSLSGAVVGALIGAGAALLAFRKSEQASKRREESATNVARQTILSEVLTNQKALAQDHYWVYEKNQPDIAPVERAAMYPAPALRSTAWDGQIHLLSKAFSMNEILELQVFYSNMESVTDSRRVLNQLYLHEAKREALIEAFGAYDAYREGAMNYRVPDRWQSLVNSA